MDYKLYFLDAGGRIAERVDLEFVDDENALALITDHLDGFAVELWRRAFHIKTFPTGRP